MADQLKAAPSAHEESNGAIGRFALVRRLGQGGFGTVFEVIDPQYDCRVALKILRREHPAAVYRFKQEFRSLADVMHPNLVRLYELIAEDGTWYFTMELVEGATFLDYVWRDTSGLRPPMVTQEYDRPVSDVVPNTAPRPFDLERLFLAAGQLAQGVQALHDARKLHCDIKPSNVLVTPEERLVLLDFGLVSEVDVEGRVGSAGLGTPGYMAPEQSLGRGVSPASDWFSVGAMLHEAMTGVIPAPGVSSFSEHNRETAELRALCADLVRERPEERPSGPEVLRRLRDQGRPAILLSETFDAGRASLFGRRVQLDLLEDAWATVTSGHTVVARVFGASGVGKTTLVRHFLDHVRREEPAALLLTGRCYEQESVPYKALDSMIDGLCRHLGRLSAGELTQVMPRNATLLARLFLGFEQVLPNRPRDESGKPPAIESQEQRRLAFVALRELIAGIAMRQPLVIFLDDLQWGDVDSASLLAELLRPPDSPRLLIIASYRPETASDGFLTALDNARLEVDMRFVTVGELPPEDARSLATHLLGRGSDDLAGPIAKEAGGSPIFIQQLAEQALARRRKEPLEPPPPLSIHDVIGERVRGLEPDAQRLLEAIAIAGQPVPEMVAAQAAELDGPGARLALLTTRHARLVVSRTVERIVLLEPAHDRVREAITAALPAEATRHYHRQLAEALQSRTQPDPETLLRHFLGAGDEPQARIFAARAAERAEAAYAFERAGHHYQVLLRLSPEGDPDRWVLTRRLADALANAGRGSEASDAFQQAADALAKRDPDHPEILSLSRRSGELALRSGLLEIGTRRMDSVLRRVGVLPPRSRREAAVLSAGRRLWLFVRGMGFKASRADTVPPEKLARLDALWGASTGVSMVNHPLADALGLQHLLETLAFGVQSHLVRGLGYEAAFEAVIGGPFLRRRCDRILSRMDELARKSDDPYDLAWAQMSKGVSAWFFGDWPASWRNCDEAAALYRERCHGVAWELAICDAYRLPALAYLGDLSKLSEVVPRALDAARERGDVFAANTLRLGQQSMTLLARDRPLEAIEEARAAIAPFPDAVYLLPHYHHLFAVAQAEIYRGDAGAAWRQIETEWIGLKQSQLLMVQCLRVEIRHLRARAALALVSGTTSSASTAGWSRERLLRAALSEAKAIERDDVAPARPLAAAIRASVASLAGRADEATLRLGEALVGFERAHMALYAHAARERLAALRPDAEGLANRAEAMSWMKAQGVQNPAAMTAMLLPGV